MIKMARCRKCNKLIKQQYQFCSGCYQDMKPQATLDFKFNDPVTARNFMDQWGIAGW